MKTYENEYGRNTCATWRGTETPTWMSHSSSTRMHALGHTRIHKHYDNLTLISMARQKEVVWSDGISWSGWSVLKHGVVSQEYDQPSHAQHVSLSVRYRDVCLDMYIEHVHANKCVCVYVYACLKTLTRTLETKHTWKSAPASSTKWRIPVSHKGSSPFHSLAVRVFVTDCIVFGVLLLVYLIWWTIELYCVFACDRMNWLHCVIACVRDSTTAAWLITKWTVWLRQCVSARANELVPICITMTAPTSI